MLKYFLLWTCDIHQPNSICLLSFSAIYREFNLMFSLQQPLKALLWFRALHEEWALAGGFADGLWPKAAYVSWIFSGTAQLPSCLFHTTASTAGHLVALVNYPVAYFILLHLLLDIEWHYPAAQLLTVILHTTLTPTTGCLVALLSCLLHTTLTPTGCIVGKMFRGSAHCPAHHPTAYYPDTYCPVPCYPTTHPTNNSHCK